MVDHGEAEAPAPPLVTPTQNLLLAQLPRAEVSKIISDSKPLLLKAGDDIFECGEEIEHLYFPISAVMSSLALFEDGSTAEISMTGREGLVGLPALIGGGQAHHWIRTSVGGAALRVPAFVMQDHFRKREAIHESVLAAYRNLFIQICQRSVCNVRHTLLQRLCVWLLMMNDRINSDELPFTHEQIASLISVRRASISVAASMLQSMPAISYHRGRIVITDRAAIEVTACECYKVLRQPFEGHESSSQPTLIPQFGAR
jgi:CRP-like cAMP-binding protein